MEDYLENYLKRREMRTVVKDEKWEWKEVKSGVPQRLVLAPIMFLIYINDMTERVSSYIRVFADYTKLLRKILQLQRLWGTAEWFKQDIWMEQDMRNGI